MRSAPSGNGGWPRAGERLPQPYLRYARCCCAAWVAGAVVLFASGFFTSLDSWLLLAGGFQFMAGAAAGFAIIVRVLRRRYEQENGE